MVKFILALFFLLTYGLFAKQITYTNIELFEDIIKIIEKEYVWSIDQKTLVEYAIEGVFDKLNSDDKRIRIASETDKTSSVEYFEEVLEQIQKKYPGLIDQETLIEYGINGMFSRLDPYSYYLDSKKLKSQIPELNTVSTEIVDYIVYIKISEFNENTHDNFRKQWLNAQENNNTVKGIVLDLRDNSGGLFSQAILICDSFLDGGEMIVVQNNRSLSKPIYGEEFLGGVQASTLGVFEERSSVSTTKEIEFQKRSNDVSSKKCYSASKGDMFSGLPLTVLINENSASASEIIAAVLQYRGRGQIVGTKSFGKASGQTIFPLKNGDAVSITNRLYYLPSGNLITGVIPDYKLQQLAELTK